MTETKLLKYNLWVVETAVMIWAFEFFDWKVLGLVFLTLWWTKLHTKVAGQ